MSECSSTTLGHSLSAVQCECLRPPRTSESGCPRHSRKSTFFGTALCTRESAVNRDLTALFGSPSAVQLGYCKNGRPRPFPRTQTVLLDPNEENIRHVIRVRFTIAFWIDLQQMAEHPLYPVCREDGRMLNHLYCVQNIGRNKREYNYV